MVTLPTKEKKKQQGNVKEEKNNNKGQGWSWQPKKPRREQLFPRLAKTEVGEELLTDKCNLPKPSKEKDKYNR